MTYTYIIGPSHIYKDRIHMINSEIINNIYFKDCILDGYNGIPIWSNHILKSISDNYNKNYNICWIVSDYKFNNFNYPLILNIKNNENLFLNTKGCQGNVSKDFLEYNHIEVLGNHSLKVIDFIINKFPNIKLIFWCLYKRTKVNKNSSYPKHFWYDEIKKKYINNIIDIDLFTTPENFDLKTLDTGGHPNKDGYKLLDNMIKSTFY